MRMAKQYEYLYHNQQVLPISQFAKCFELNRITIQETQLSVQPSEYRPLYWMVFKDVTKYLWVSVLGVSVGMLIVKIVFYAELAVNPDQTVGLMSIENFEGLEIYFNEALSTDGSIQVTVTAGEYVKAFLPNLGIVLVSVIALITTRVDSQKNLEQYSFEISSRAFKFYITMVWIWLALLISTAKSVYGFVFLLLQLLLTLKIFVNKKSPHQLEIICVHILKYFIYIMVTGLYLMGTPQGVDSQKRFAYLANFLGFELIPEVFETNWIAIVFFMSSLLLFVFLCLLSEQMQYAQIRMKLLLAIHKATEYRDSMIGMSDISRKSYVEQINKYILVIADNVRSSLDSPFVTLRVVQVSTIIVIILQKTYYSLVLTLWVFGTGFTLNMSFNQKSTIFIGIPMMFLNLITQMYSNISKVGLDGNEFNICDDNSDSSGGFPETNCEKFGFFQDNLSELNIIIMDVTLCGYLLLLRQIQEYFEVQKKDKLKKQDHLNFMSKHKKEKSDDLSLVSYSTIFIAFIFKMSYFVSLIILFWVGFYQVNLIQFILVLFLLIFLINDSQRSTIKIKKKAKVVNGEHIKPEEKTLLIPFAFKYWVFLVIYVDLIILLQYIFEFFFEVSSKGWSQQTIAIVNFIGFSVEQDNEPKLNQKNSEILFWTLFYFVALQFDAYRSKVYIKYSNRIIECITAKDLFKRFASTYENNQGLFYLMYLRFIIWFSFSVNIVLLITSGFSFINLLLFVVVGSIFCHFASSLIDGVNYRLMRQLWYIYLHILVIVFVLRYLFQFVCLDTLILQNETVSNFYKHLNGIYEEIGLYPYDPLSMETLRIEYLPDMITIFLGALSLNTFEIFSISQDKLKIEAMQKEFKQPEQRSLSQTSQEESSITDGVQSNLIQQKRTEETHQIAQMMKISILDSWTFAKTPILIYANINTDIVTMIVVLVAVFVTRSIAIWLIMVLYLRYYFVVNNQILKTLQEKQVNAKINDKIEAIKTKYLRMKDQDSEAGDTDKMEIKRLVDQIKLIRLNTRIEIKRVLGKQSFFFTAFCILMTYASLALTDTIGYPDSTSIPDWWRDLNYAFYIFGTYARMDASPSTVNNNNFCQSTQNIETESKSNILANIWFFMVLCIANVIDFMCTQILMEDLKHETNKFNNVDDDEFQDKPPQDQKKLISKREKPLDTITEEEEKDNAVQEDAEKGEEEIQMDETQQAIKEFQMSHPYIILSEEHPTDSKSPIDEISLKSTTKRYALLIQFYKNKDIILAMTFWQASFKTMSRVLILLFLLNTVLVDNIFSLFYLAVSVYLFLRKPDYRSIMILSQTSILAIFIQYLFLLLNFQPIHNSYSGVFPSIIAVDNLDQFSIVQQIFKLTDQSLLMYLGFQNKESVSSDNHLTSIQDNLYWVFVLNTIVLSLIYAYFLLFEFLTINILRNTVEIETGVQATEQFLYLYLKNDQERQIQVNYPKWKGRFYSFKMSLFKAIVRNGHLILGALILVIAQTDRVIFNTIETLLVLVFFFIAEIIYEWPYIKNHQNMLIKYFKVLFYVPVITILCYTGIKEPSVNIWCTQQPNEGEKENQYKIFLCSQINNLHIIGMEFIMFFIALYFDLMNSVEHQECIKSYQKQSLLKARMISKSLAYSNNHHKYREIQYEQHQKNIFKEIQAQIMEKLRLWHRRMKEQQGISSNNKTKTSDGQVVQKNASGSIDIEDLKDGDLVEKQEQSYDPESNFEVEKLTVVEEKKQEEQEEKPILIKIIEWLQDNNDNFKYMSVSNLMDFILSQNQLLNRHVYITVDHYINENWDIYSKELDIIDAFYFDFFKRCQDLQQIDENSIEQILNDIVPQQLINQSQLQDAYAIKQQPEVQKKIFTLQRSEARHTFDEYKHDRDFTYVHIVDPKLQFINTKIFARYRDYKEFTNKMLALLFIKESFRYLISNWSVLCYILFILYYCKNTALLGAFLPVLMFTWVLIEEGEAPKIFWAISYCFFAGIILFISILSQEGLKQAEENKQSTPWYYPLYDSDTEMVFESILIWMIVIQLFLQKKWGVFNQTITQVENIFKGYLRMRINRSEKIAEVDQKMNQPRTHSAVFQNAQTQFQQVVQPRSSSLAVERVSSVEPLNQQIEELDKMDEEQFKKKMRYRNKFEMKFLQDPENLTSNDQFTFFQRTFASKFAKPGKDLYSYLAFIQLIIFLYMLLFFTSMTSETNGINDIIKQNQVPGSLVVALIAHAILMVLERYITLRTPYVNEQEQIESLPSIKSEQQFSIQNSDGNSENGKEQVRKEHKQSFSEKYRVQFLIKYALQLFLMALIFWFVFIDLGKPFMNQLVEDKDGSTLLQDQQQKSITFNTNGAIIVFFLLYCVYFYISALQLKYGYRELKLRNTFLESYSQTGYIFGKTFYAIPFLFELKVLMDWTFLETSLDVFQWFKLEDIHGLMYFAKIQSQGYQTRKVGEKIITPVKIGMGCSLVTFILACIFAPLLLFSTLNPATELNLVNGGDFLITLVNDQTGLKVPLYQSNQLSGLNQTVSNVTAAFNTIVTNQIINQAAQNNELQQFQLLSFSNTDWSVSAPLFNLLVDQIQDQLEGRQNYSFYFNVTYGLTRQKSASQSIVSSFQYPGNQFLSQLPGNNQTSLNNTQLATILNNINTCAQEQLFLENFYVQTLQIYSTDGTTFKPRPMIGKNYSVQSMTANLYCRDQLNVSAKSTPTWWNFTYAGTSRLLNSPSQSGMIFFVVSDKYSPLTTGFSIITIYTSVILLIGTFIRSLFSGQVWLIQFTDMLKPDDLLMICQAISIARTQKDFVKENLLYFELIDILRSPEIVKVMTGSWSETFKKKYVQERVEEERRKLKAD